MRSRGARVGLGDGLWTGLRDWARCSEFGERLDSRVRVDCGACGRSRPGFLATSSFFFLETKPYVATHEAVLERLTKYLYRHPESYLVFTAHNCLQIRNVNTKYKSPETTQTLFGRNFHTVRARPFGRRVLFSGDAMSLETSETRDPTPDEVQAARAKADAKRGASESPHLSGISAGFGRFLVSQPLTLPFPTSPPQPMPWRRDSRLPNPTRRAYRTRGTPATPWTPASVCSATTPDTSSAHVVAKRSSTRPRMNR